MKKHPDEPDSPGGLRTNAEAQLSRAQVLQAPTRSAHELLHELQVHQIELEMQNESLRQAQLALEESRDRYLDLYVFAPVGYLTLSGAGLIEESNLSAATLLGVTRKKLIHRRFAHFVAPGKRDNWHRLFLQALQHGEALQCELSLQRNDGTLFDARLDCLAAHGDGTSALRIALSDITARNHRTMAELQSSEQRFHDIARASADWIWEVDADGRYTFASDGVQNFLGYTPAEIMGKTPFDLMPPDEAKKVSAEFSAIAARREPFRNLENINRHKDGSLRYVRTNGAPILDADGKLLGYRGVDRDDTPQKLLEKEVRERRHEMELLVKRQVAAQTSVAIAHELNQPLIAITAYCEAALSMLRGGTKNPEKLVRALEGAAEQAQRAGRTLHELLDFLHKGETSLALLDLNEVVREALAIAEENGYGGFRPVIELARDLPPVSANRLQIQKVLVNLLHNAVDAMRAADAPTAAITITVRTATDGNMAQVTVQDSGAGLNAETIQHIFEPFFTTKPAGIGLGLAISRALIEAHGGRLWAESTSDASGCGAIFHFTLPFAP